MVQATVPLCEMTERVPGIGSGGGVVPYGATRST